MKIAALLFTLPLTCLSCPGSPSSVHASCKMIVTFEQKCSVVRNEILARISGENGWKDPHNGGTYTLQSDNGQEICGSRRTGDNKYTDLFDFFFTDDLAGQHGCHVEACSKSQVFSILDFSTNYCNLFVLYCNSTEGCPIVHQELTYKEEYTSCRQRTKQNCLALSDNL